MPSQSVKSHDFSGWQLFWRSGQTQGILLPMKIGEKSGDYDSIPKVMEN